MDTLKWTGFILVALMILLILVASVARLIHYFYGRITTKAGISEKTYVSIGSQEQYLHITGKDRNNPIMLLLHGGPGGPDGFINYPFTKYLMEDYTVVYWNQRGCGRTFFRNKKSDPQNETATFEQALKDLDELVDYLRNRFKKERVILFGHSYGTLLGSSYAMQHPGKVEKYIGVGQMVSMESEIFSYRDALEKAKKKGDDTKDMEAAGQAFIQDKTMPNMINLRMQVNKYHKVPKCANQIWLGLASPHMNIADVRWFLKSINHKKYMYINRHLFDYVLQADVRDYGLEYKMPVVFLSGACDWITPAEVTRTYCEEIQAPWKAFDTLEACGHAPQLDSPKAFCDKLKHALKKSKEKSRMQRMEAK